MRSYTTVKEDRSGTQPCACWCILTSELRVQNFGDTVPTLYSVWQRIITVLFIYFFFKQMLCISKTSKALHYGESRKCINWHDRKQKTKNKIKPGQKYKLTQQPEPSRVDKGDCNVAGAVGGGQAFVEVGETSWMHEAPAFPWWLYRTVVSMETATSTLIGDRKWFAWLSDQNTKKVII